MSDGHQLITAVCPLGLNQICHLTVQRLITVSETRDSKGSIYHTSAVLSPNEQLRSSEPELMADGTFADGMSGRASVASTRSSASAGGFYSDRTKCSLAALARHGKRFVVVALRGQIWFAELNNQPSSEVMHDSTRLSASNSRCVFALSPCLLAKNDD